MRKRCEELKEEVRLKIAKSESGSHDPWTEGAS
jgi:hypothetical protein